MEWGFNKGKPAASGSGQPNAGGQGGGGQGQGNGQGQQPNGGQGNGNGGGSQNQATNPLDAFAKVFDNTPKEGAPKAPKFELSAESLQTASGGLSFSDFVTPEFISKFQSGDITAVKEAFDSVGRRAYSHALDHSSRLTDRFVDARMSHDRSGLGAAVRGELTRNSLSQVANDNPILKSHLETISSGLLREHPDADPAWIEEQTRGYFLEAAKLLDPTLNDKLKNGESGKPGQAVNPAEADANYWQDRLTGKATKKQ